MGNFMKEKNGQIWLDGAREPEIKTQHISLNSFWKYCTVAYIVGKGYTYTTWIKHCGYKLHYNWLQLATLRSNDYICRLGNIPFISKLARKRHFIWSVWWIPFRGEGVFMKRKAAPGQTSNGKWTITQGTNVALSATPKSGSKMSEGEMMWDQTFHVATTMKWLTACSFKGKYCPIVAPPLGYLSCV